MLQKVYLSVILRWAQIPRRRMPSVWGVTVTTTAQRYDKLEKQPQGLSLCLNSIIAIHCARVYFACPLLDEPIGIL